MFASVGDIGVIDTWHRIAAHPESDVVGKWRVIFYYFFTINDFYGLRNNALVFRIILGNIDSGKIIYSNHCAVDIAGSADLASFFTIITKASEISSVFAVGISWIQ